MISNQKLKSVKWISIVGAIVNIVLIGILLGALAQFRNFVPYAILIYIAVIDIAFSLLLISSSCRIDQIFYRLKWVNMLCSALTLTIVLAIFFISRENAGTDVEITMKWPIYLILGIAIVLMSTDVVIVKLKYRNNPFYHNGKFKKTYTNYTDVTNRYEPKKDNDQEVVYEDKTQQTQQVKQEVVDELANLSYFERYQKRSEELQKVDEDFDNGLITEQEYQKRRKEIYARYDRYN